METENWQKAKLLEAWVPWKQNYQRLTSNGEPKVVVQHKEGLTKSR